MVCLSACIPQVYDSDLTRPRARAHFRIIMIAAAVADCMMSVYFSNLADGVMLLLAFSSHCSVVASLTDIHRSCLCHLQLRCMLHCQARASHPFLTRCPCLHSFNCRSSRQQEALC